MTLISVLLSACGGSSANPVPPTATATAVLPLPATESPVTPTPSPAATEEIQATVAMPTPRPTVRADPELTEAIDGLLDGQKGVYGIVIIDEGGDPAFERNADTPFLAASLYKLILLADIYRKREDGELSFNEQVRLDASYYPEPGDFADSVYDRTTVGSTARVDDLVFATGAYSSNVAAKALLSLTSTSSLDETTISLGLSDTYLFIDPMTLPAWTDDHAAETSPEYAEAINFIEDAAEEGPVNITTPHDMCRYFEMLLDGEIVNDDVSDEILAILKQQMVDDRFPYLLLKKDDPVELAHKTGNLDHVVHDVGIIWTPDGPVILAAMVEDPPNDDRATQIIQRLALIAYGDLDVPAFTKKAVDDASPPADDADDDEAADD